MPKPKNLSDDDSCSDSGSDMSYSEASDDDVLEDYYEILELTDVVPNEVTYDMIKKKYNQLVLQYHPDKNPDADSEIFENIQKAYETLSDPDKKSIYDSEFMSNDEYDDFDIELYPFESLYKKFGPVYEYLGRFSVVKPVPKLGNEDTPYSEVEQFYKFWRNDYSSWRDFSYCDEYNAEDLESAENRLERRWMNRQNENSRRKMKKYERNFVEELINFTYKNDTRIKLHNEAEKERKKQEKLQEKLEKERFEQEKKELERKQKEEKEAFKNNAKQKEINNRINRAKELMNEKGLEKYIDQLDFNTLSLSKLKKWCQLLNNDKVKEAEKNIVHTIHELN